METLHKLYYEISHIAFFSKTFWNNSILDYAITTLLFILIYFISKPTIKLIFFVARKIVNRTSTEKDNIIINYIDKKRKEAFVPVEILIAFYFSIQLLNYPQHVADIISYVMIIFCTILVVSAIINFIRHTVRFKYSATAGNEAKANSFELFFPIIKITIWILAIFFVLSNTGFDVGALLTGLGIGGIAIAFASQAVLSDLLSFISIASDKPFEIGDYIAVNGVEGTVTKIGIRSVRIERNMGEEVIVPNSTITKSDLHNYKKLNKRRADLLLSITTQTSNAKLELIPTIIANICAENDKIRFIHCHFSSILAHCYEFSAVYYVVANDFSTYANAKQFVNLRIKEELEKHQIELAYPTQIIKITQQANG